MKTSLNILIAACFISCIGQPGQGGGQSIFTEQPKTVYAYAPVSGNAGTARWEMDEKPDCYERST